MFNRELSGDTSTIIGGLPYTIITRHRLYPGNDKAAQYIYEKFLGYGLQAENHVYTSTGANVIGRKEGYQFPNQQYIICGHFDDCVWSSAPDTIPGADDNASGVCAVLEAARILSQYNFKYTILFIAFDEEEGTNGGYTGSIAYADTARLRGDSILGVINLDMIGYDEDNDHIFQVTTDANSVFLAGVVLSSAGAYARDLIPLMHLGSYGSDQQAFWYVNYHAVAMHENLDEFNRYYHTVNDRFIYLNLPYMTNIVKSAIASLIVLENDFIINFEHDPLQSNYDTLPRIASFVITSNHQIEKHNNSKCTGCPRLYYKAGNGQYMSTFSFYNNLDTFKYLVPGFSPGSVVTYYIAVQDSLGTMVGSLPGGARGFNPPGSIPPPVALTYIIYDRYNICSNDLPKPVPPKQFTYDTIHISHTGTIRDYNLNLTLYHTNDSDLYIWLLRPNVQMFKLSWANGGSGDNYFNTTFDDEASIPITQGTPPFTGSYIPEQPLSSYDNLPWSGDWILRIYNNSQTVTGTLAGWCLYFDYYNPIGIKKNQIPVRTELSQNYPNPFNSSTKINFSLEKKSRVKIVVFDMLGREITVLANDTYNNGDYNMSFNAANLASGLYFYTLFIDGNLYQTKKMVLIK